MNDQEHARRDQVRGDLPADPIDHGAPIPTSLPGPCGAGPRRLAAREVWRIHNDQLEALAGNRPEEVATQCAHAKAVQVAVDCRAKRRAP
jgi:hypothetical protein